jgi:hypothetical protein
MDANELNALLEDVREFMAVLRTGERAYIDTLTATAKENKIAAKAIGHIIEQHLLKVILSSCVTDLVGAELDLLVLNLSVGAGRPGEQDRRPPFDRQHLPERRRSLHILL